MKESISLKLARKFINKDVLVMIDRPKGSKHPKHGFIYPVNYGFIPNTIAPDGAELDAYILNIEEPKDKFKGRCIVIIHREDDDDDKLVVVPGSIDLTDDEIAKQVEFQEQWFRSSIVRE